jgi:hypothetical protein
MSSNQPDFKQPPWVMGSPKEVMDWIEATHPSKKDRKKTDHKSDNKFLTNLHIKFDFNVKYTKVEPSNIFSKFILKITGNEIVEEEFDLLATTELILRGLAKAKFRNTAKIVVNNKILYEHPEKKSDLRKTIDDISEFSHEISTGKKVEITAILADVERSTAIIKINKIHSKKDHSVDIQIKGKIRKEIYHTFLNYLKDEIGLKD